MRSWPWGTRISAITCNFILLSGLLMVGCTEDNPYFCNENKECEDKAASSAIESDAKKCHPVGHLCYPGCQQDSDCRNTDRLNLGGLVCDRRINQCVSSVDGGPKDDQSVDAPEPDAAVDGPQDGPKDAANDGDGGTDAPKDLPGDDAPDQMVPDILPDIIEPDVTTKLGPGAVCQFNSECLSGFCTDGHCCTVASCGTCKACNTSGVCANVSGNPKNVCGTGSCAGTCQNGACSYPATKSCGECKECNKGSCVAVTDDTDPFTQCGTDANCKGTCKSGACSYAPSTKSCGSTCTTNKNRGELFCDGKGACDPTPKNVAPCGTCKKCDQGTCQNVTAGLDTFNECTGTHASCGGTCQNGACSYPSNSCGTCHQCKGGNCNPIDGSDPFSDCGTHSTCKGTCRSGACQYPETVSPGGKKSCGECQECKAGKCDPVASNTDPFNQCTGSHSECGGKCQSGACSYAPATKQCALTCNAADTKHPGIRFCDGVGGCEATPSGAQTCQTCYRCRPQTPQLGCQPVDDNTNPDNDCGSDVTCAGKCQSGSCSFPATTVRCDATCSGTNLNERFCDGAGVCNSTAKPKQCAPFLCETLTGDDRCYPTCENHTQCISTSACNRVEAHIGGAKCVPQTQVIFVKNTSELHNALPTASGKTIRLRPATYTGDIRIDGGAYTLVGESGVILTPGLDRRIEIIFGSLTLQGVAIQNSLGSGVSCQHLPPGGPSLRTALTILESRIQNNRGVGVQSTDCGLIVRRSEIRGNDAGGVDALRGTLTVSNSWLIRNAEGSSSSAVAGIRIRDVNSGEFVYNTVANNGGHLLADVICSNTALNLRQSALVRSSGCVRQNTCEPGCRTYSTYPNCIEWHDKVQASDSMCIDKGAEFIFLDVDNVVRVSSSYAPDLGAHEVVPN